MRAESLGSAVLCMGLSLGCSSREAPSGGATGAIGGAGLGATSGFGSGRAGQGGAQPSAGGSAGGTSNSGASQGGAGMAGSGGAIVQGGQGGQGGGASAGTSSGNAGSAAGGIAGSAAGAGGTTGGGGSDAGTGGAEGGNAGSAGAMTGDPKFWIFLLLGQSNMVGQPQPQSQDLVPNPAVEVLAYDDCSNVNRNYNQWYTAYPPLHQCDAGVGPGDYFARNLLEILPADHTIGLVPCAVNGAPIDLFRKGVARTGYDLPPDNHWETGYEWIISRAREAQKVGVIRGILFHQGESNSEQPDWPEKVQGLVNDLRADLGIGEVPFLAGELYQGGCCPDHNALVHQLPGLIPNAFVVSSSGLDGTDQYHFDLPSQRELGTRYGTTMQNALMPE